MKKVIAISGKSSVGKTSSVKELYSLLKQTYPNHSLIKEIINSDIQIIIEINQTKIGIESQGDPNCRLFKSLPLFVKHGCQIIICATRTRGKTKDAVKALKCEDYDVEFIEKTASSLNNYDEINKATAQEILSRIQEFLGKP